MAAIVTVSNGNTSDEDHINQFANALNNVLGITDTAQDALGRLVLPRASSAPGTPSDAELYFDTDDDLARIYNGSVWQLLDGSIFVPKTADETVNNSATLQADDHLVFPVESAGVYIIQVFLVIDRGSSAAEFKCDFTIPAGGSITGSWPHTDASLSSIIQGIRTAAGSVADYDPGFSGAIAAPPMTLCYVAGGTAGNVTLRWAQNAADAVDTIVKKGSFMLGRKVTV